MNTLENYIIMSSKLKFDLKTNNCLHFALGYHGLRHLVPDDCDIQYGPDYIDRVVVGLEKHGFKATNNKLAGNIVACKVPKHDPALGLRLIPERCALLCLDGILRTFNYQVIREWEPCPPSLV